MAKILMIHSTKPCSGDLQPSKGSILACGGEKMRRWGEEDGGEGVRRCGGEEGGEVKEVRRVGKYGEEV